MAPLILLEDGVYGRRAILGSDWDGGMADFIRRNDVVELELNMAKGWKAGASLAFLAELPFLRAFEIFDFLTKDIAPIHELGNLRRLGITTYCSTPIHFGAFPQLESCGLEWRPRSDSLFQCVGLKQLFVNRYKGQNVDAFAHFVNLESLSILNAPVKNLSGLRPLHGLRYLRLGRLTSLTSLEGIEHLLQLETLDIQTCSNLYAINEVSNLKSLKKLHINHCGGIRSLDPLDGLDLEWLTFDESTNIEDGDMNPLLRQRRLVRVAFQNRKHYTHRSEQIREKLLQEQEV